MKLTRRKFLQAIGITPVIPAVHALPEIKDPEPKAPEIIYYGHSDVMIIEVATMESDHRIWIETERPEWDFTLEMTVQRYFQLGDNMITPHYAIGSDYRHYVPVDEQTLVSVYIDGKLYRSEKAIWDSVIDGFRPWRIEL